MMLPDLRRFARSLRRLAPALALAALVAVPMSSLPAGRAAASTELTVPQAELHLLQLLNARRTGAGLVPYRVDPRLMAIARERSTDMATKNYFSHTQPDGRKVFDYLTERGITWHGAGENIAWNTYPSLAESAAVVNTGWTNSSSHNANVMSTGYNYVGIGLAIGDGGKRYWTAVVMKGPDRTGARGTLGSVSKTGTTSTGISVAVRWSGSDPRLQVLTAGLADFQVQRRSNGGTWSTVRSATTSTSLAQTLERGRLWEFRVRARDKAGNYGSWSAPLGIRT